MKQAWSDHDITTDEPTGELKKSVDELIEVLKEMEAKDKEHDEVIKKLESLRDK